MWPFHKSQPVPATDPLHDVHERLSKLEQRVGEALIQEEDVEAVLQPFVELLTEFAADLEAMEKRLNDGLQLADRREKRIRAAVTRGLARLEEEGVLDENLEATLAEVLERDGGGRPPQGMPPVRESVDPRQTDAFDPLSPPLWR